MPQAWIIERIERQSPATAWRAVLWADVNTPERRRFYEKPATWVSAYRDATLQQLTDLRAGLMTESVITLTYQDAAPFLDVRNDIVQALNAFQNRTDNLNLWNRYGTYWNGTSWSITNNP
jgi:hypothetical protein